LPGKAVLMMLSETSRLGAGGSWPVSAEKEVRYAACIGANTVHWIDGQHGYRFYCNAPDR